MKKRTILAALGLCCGIAHADAPAATPADGDAEKVIDVVITPTRNPEPLAQTTSAVTVITRKQIEEKKAFDLTDILDLAPSLTLSQTGTRGKQTSIFLRGANSNQTLILMDGQRINLPSSGAVDFGSIPADNIERIEVLRGPQSALYGSDAMGGVINIITRRGAGPLKTGGSIEFGNYGTNRQEGSVRGALGNGDLSLAITRLQSNGLNSNDDYRNLGASLRYDQALARHTNLAFIGRASTGEVGVPGQSEFVPFDPNERDKEHDLVGTLQLTHDAGKRRDRISLGAFDKVLHDDNPADPINLGSSTTRFRDRVMSLDGQTSYDFGRNVLTAGVELRHDKASDDGLSVDPVFGPFATNFSNSTSTRAVFAQDEFHQGRWSLVPGVRWEDNSQFGNSVNGRLAAAYQLDVKSRLKASIGTGFRAPSIDELYFPGFSNPNLKPEKSVGYEIGYARNLNRHGQAELTLFRNRYRDIIAFVAGSPVNVNHATIEGLEIGYSQDFGRGWRAAVNQSFLNVNTSGAPLARRPKYASTADLIYHHNKINYDLGLVAQGRRYDVDQNFATTPFGGYTRFDFSMGYNLSAGRQLYIRAQNLTNRHYEAVAGYPAPHLNFVVGLQTSAF